MSYIPVIDSFHIVNLVETLIEMKEDWYFFVKESGMPNDILAIKGHVATKVFIEFEKLLYDNLSDEKQIQFVKLAAQKNAKKYLEQIDLSKCENLLDALIVVCSNIAKVSSSANFYIKRNFNKCWICRPEFGYKEDWFSISEVYIVSCFIELITILTGKPFIPEYICLITGEYKLCQKLSPSFPAKFFTHRGYTAVEIPKEMKSMPILDIHKGKCDNLEFLSGSTEVAIKMFLPMYFSGARPTLAKTAQITGLSERTIKRRLLAEGTSFKRVLDEIMFTMSSDRLANTDTPIGEIAYDLGYSSQAHFTRAFKRCSSVTPKEYRKIHEKKAAL